MSAQQKSAPLAAGGFAPMPAPSLLHIPSLVPQAEAQPAWIAPGTHVSAGNALTEPALDRLGRAVIAPVSGVAGEGVRVRLPDERVVHAIDFHPDHPLESTSADASEPEWAALEQTLAATTPKDLPEWTERLARLGIAVDRWACRDLIGQLRQASSRKIDSVICSLLDSDPWLAVNRAVGESAPAELAAGIGLLARLTGATRIWAMIDQADGRDWSDGLREQATRFAGQLRLAPIENDYPQPDPTLLVYAVTRRRLKPGQLPTEKNVLLLDGAAAVAIGRAARSNLALSSVPVLVYDQPGDQPHRLAVTPGTMLSSILEHLNIPIAVREVYAGSPLRQRRALAGDVIGAAGELTFFVAPPQPRVPASPCTRCGWCIEGCPTRCRPAGLLEAAQREDLDLAQRNGLDACIECGLCTYVCPSRLPILQGIRTLK